MRKIPLNLFGMAFGTAGLGGTWLTAAAQGYAPEAVAIVLLVIAAVLWAVVLGFYATYAIGQRALVKDLMDPIGSPFAALALITPMLVAGQTLPRPAATVVVDVFAALIGAIAVRTAIGLLRNTLLPAPTPDPLPAGVDRPTVGDAG